MLLLLGPWFDATPEGFSHLAQVTGLLAYELRARIKPGCWGVVRALGDAAQAQALAAQLQSEGFPVVVVDQRRAMETERRAVLPNRVVLERDVFLLWMGEEAIPLEYWSLMLVVRGEIGRTPPPRSSPSSSKFRPVVPSPGEVQAFRDAAARSTEPYPVADLHFLTVPWFARLDVRALEIPVALRVGAGPTRDLERLVDVLAERSGARIDRAYRNSSVGSFTSPAPRTSSPPPSSRRGRESAADDPFDVYSRVVAEAEVMARELGIVPPAVRP